MKILLIEDNSFFASFYKNKLTVAGYEVSIAADGELAITSIKANQPDIIILDLIMPNKDGFEVLKELKADNQLKQIPVIVFSALSQEEDIQKAKNLGAIDYFDKNSSDVTALLEKISSLSDKAK